MNHYRIHLDYPEGSIEVQFDLEFDGSQSYVTEILLHTNGKIELPISLIPELKLINGKYILTYSYPVLENGKSLSKEESIQSPYGPDIVEEILRIKEEQTPKFT